MITKVYPCGADFDNLSRFKLDAIDKSGSVDVSSVIVKKPWGYEYLWYENPTVAVWMLYLLPQAATSLHCHSWKRTSLIVMEGQVVCSTLESRYRLDIMDVVVLQPCVFHSTLAVSENGAWVMEVESPPAKGDLLRLKDQFGREGTGYEKASEYTQNFAAFDYHPLILESRDRPQRIGQVSISVHLVNQRELLCGLLRARPLLVLTTGKIISGTSVAVDTGEAFNASQVDCGGLPPRFAPLELISMERCVE
jgi:hypothetical protein